MISFYNKISPELLQVSSLRFDDCTSECIVYARNYTKLKRAIIANYKDFTEYPFINAFGIKLTNKQIISMAKTNIVSFITNHPKVSTQIDVAKKILDVQPFYMQKDFGDSASIAIIDTGINPHLDFCLGKNRIIKFVDLINNKSEPYDDNGHGTFVASIACGSGVVSNKKYSGVAPKSNIISIKALEKNGETGAYKILEAMQWVYDNYKKYNIRVVCMSFGSSPLDKNDPLVIGAETLWNLGIVVVAAAGNSGPEKSTIKSPGISSKIITVGGLNDKRDDEGHFDDKLFEVASFSSRGPVYPYFKPDLIAPAVNITGADFDKFYTKMSGTSVATPMIAGACLLIISKYPQITPDQLKVKLLRNCKKISSNYNDDGFGLANFSNFFK